MTQRLAGRGSRLGAILLDNVMMVLSLLPGGLAAVSADESYGNDGMGAALFLLVVGFVGFLGVQIYLLVQQGQTIGKRAVGIRIVDYSDGSLLGAGRILGMRGVLPGVIASIPYVGWLFALVDVLFIFGEERRCIHDHMAQSKVVDGDAAESTGETSKTARSAAADETEPASTQSAVSSSAAEQSSPDRRHSDPSPAVPPSVDRLRQVLRNLEELRDDGTITEEKFQRGRRTALADFVEETDAEAEAIVRGVRHTSYERSPFIFLRPERPLRFRFRAILSSVSLRRRSSSRRDRGTGSPGPLASRAKSAQLTFVDGIGSGTRDT